MVVVTGKKTISRWKLVANGSWLAGQEFPLYEEGTILGRGKTCDVIIPGTHLSRNHAQLSILGDRLQVKDLNSSNGTFINEERVREAFAKPGDIIRLDVYTFSVVGPGDAQGEQKPQSRTAAVSVSAAQALENIKRMKMEEEKDYTQTEWITKPTSVGNRTHNVPSQQKGHDASFWFALAFGLCIIGGLIYYFVA